MVLRVYNDLNDKLNLTDIGNEFVGQSEQIDLLYVVPFQKNENRIIIYL